MASEAGRQLQVLQNWLDKPVQVRCSIRVNETALAGRKVFVYAGNMGVAQGMDILLIWQKTRTQADAGLLFVGRGSDVHDSNHSPSRQLSNVLFFDEIDPDEIPDLYSQCQRYVPRPKTQITQYPW